MSASRFSESFFFSYLCHYYSWDNTRLDTKGEEKRRQLWGRHRWRGQLVNVVIHLRIALVSLAWHLSHKLLHKCKANIEVVVDRPLFNFHSDQVSDRRIKLWRLSTWWRSTSWWLDRLGQGFLVDQSIASRVLLPSGMKNIALFSSCTTARCQSPFPLTFLLFFYIL